MKMPALLPDSLAQYASIKSEDELLEALTSNPLHLVQFFEAAASDETWSHEHAGLIKKICNWVVEEFCANRMLIEHAKRIKNSIQNHHLILLPYLKRDLTVIVEDEKFEVNSLLFGTSCNSFHDQLLAACQENRNNEVVLLNIQLEYFPVIKEAFETGRVQALWKFENQEVRKLLKLSTDLEFQDLSEECQIIMTRYLTQGNVIDTLVDAHENGWIVLRTACFDFVNAQKVGVQFKTISNKYFCLEFQKFQQTSLSIFEQLRSFITHLGFSQSLIEEGPFSELLKRVSKLIYLDISRTTSFSERLHDIPEGLQELDISKCAWLGDRQLQQMFEICPALVSLNISSNTQLSYKGFSYLGSLKKLESLDISRCHQIQDREFSIILNACPNLTYLSMESVSEVTDRKYHEVAEKLPHLRNLVVSRCSIGDQGLIEIGSKCKQLTSIDLTRAEKFSEKGVIELAQHAINLKTLILERTPIPKDIIQKIQKKHPFIKITP